MTFELNGTVTHVTGVTRVARFTITIVDNTTKKVEMTTDVESFTYQKVSGGRVIVVGSEKQLRNRAAKSMGVEDNLDALDPLTKIGQMTRRKSLLKAAR